MLAIIHDNTWNVRNMQHIILKDPPTWLKVATKLEKPPTPTHWQDQAITWTNIDWSLVKSSDSHIRAISKEMPQPSITKFGLKTTYIKFHSNFPGANELKSGSHSEAPFNLFQAPLTTCTGSLLWSTPFKLPLFQ